MRLLLDTHILLGLLKETLEATAPSVAAAMARPDIDACVSAASLWEIAIKTRLGKLEPGMNLGLLPQAITVMGFTMLPITASHALAEISPLPATRDPFDRLLLAQCIVEDRRLVTLDHALADHPFAARLTPIIE